MTVTTGSYTYSGSAQGPVAGNVNKGGSSGSVTLSYAGTGYGPTPTPPTAAGNYTVTATVAADSNYNQASSSDTAFTINKATPTVTVTPGSYTYSGSAQGPVSGDVNKGGSSGSLTLSYAGTSYGPSTTPPTAAGNYTVTATVAADSNYNSASSSATAFTINQRALTFTGSKTYDGNASATAAQLTFGNNVDGVNLTISGSVTLAGASAGLESISSFGLTLGGSAAGNYTLTGASGSVTVGKASAAFTVTPYTVTYDGNAHTAAVSTITGVNSETDATVGTVTLSSTIHTNAGTYSSDSWSFTGTANYSDIGSTTIIDTINKASAIVVVTPYTVTYDGNGHQATVTSITGANGETDATVGTVTLSTTHTNAATYGSDSWSFTGAANYNDIGSTTISDTINQRALTFTGSKTYDGSVTAQATELTFGNNVDGGNLTKSGSVTLSGAGAGSQSISSFGGLSLGGTAAGNYTLTGASGSVTVGMATPTVTVTPGSYTYSGSAQGPVAGNVNKGGSSGSLTLSYAGTSYGPSTTPPTAAGNYTVTATVAADSNYNSASSSATAFTINQRALTFTGSKTYDGNASATAAQLTFGNNVDGVNLTISGSVTLAGASAGLESIISFGGLSLGGSAAGNYTLTGASGSVTVGQASSWNVTSILVTNQGVSASGSADQVGTFSVDSGSTFTINYTAGQWCYISDVNSNGTSLGGDPSVTNYTLTLGPVLSDMTATCTFSRSTWTIVNTVSGSGSASPAGDISVLNGNGTAITYTADSSWYSTTATPGAFGVASGNGTTQAVLTFTAVTNNTTANGTFTELATGSIVAGIPSDFGITQGVTADWAAAHPADMQTGYMLNLNPDGINPSLGISALDMQGTTLNVTVLLQNNGAPANTTINGTLRIYASTTSNGTYTEVATAAINQAMFDSNGKCVISVAVPSANFYQTKITYSY